jgi:hypothetical protein
MLDTSGVDIVTTALRSSNRDSASHEWHDADHPPVVMFAGTVDGWVSTVLIMPSPLWTP